MNLRRSHRHFPAPRILAVAVACAAAAVPIAQAATSHRGLTGKRGATGSRGAKGPEGVKGAQGIAGNTGSPAATEQPIALNWQNGRWQGRESVGFSAPGIGSGQFLCSPDAQQVVFTPDSSAADTVMFTTRMQDGETVVREARREFNTGAIFNEGLNRFALEGTSTGAMTGIISSRLDRNSPGGPGPSPTVFHISWHWTFSPDGSSSRCYISGTVTTGS